MELFITINSLAYQLRETSRNELDLLCARHPADGYNLVTDVGFFVVTRSQSTKRQLVQTITRIAITLARFFWNILLLESALLIIIALLWRLTGWYTTTGYGGALATSGGIIIGIALLGLTTGGSSEDSKLTDAEMEMRSWDRKGLRRFTSPFAERTQTMGWLISLGLFTIAMGVVFNAFFP